MPCTSYLTGTFDMIHPGHIAFLKACRALLPTDARFVIGLTTDDLARRQKRATTMNYEHRRAILINFPFVDVVLAHTGQSKVDMHRMLQFDVLFTGEEYYGMEEYMSVTELCRVMYVPCPLSRRFSSSALARAQALEYTSRLSVLKDGTAGLVYMLDVKPVPLLFKTVRISQMEFDGDRTANVYDLPVPPPRNMKQLGAKHKYPNIPGVNGYRELEAQKIIAEFQWCNTLQVVRAYDAGAATTYSETFDDYRHMNLDKMNAREIYFVHQRHSGATMHEWINTHEGDSNFKQRLRDIIEMVYVCLDDLKSVGLVHGDVHPENVCLSTMADATTGPVVPVAQRGRDDDDYKVTLIDFGWCMHRSFVMDHDEREYYEQCLTTNWDYEHFKNSIEYYYHDRAWYPVELAF